MAGSHTIDIEQLVRLMTTEQIHGWSSRSECAECKIGRPVIHRTNKNLRNKYKNVYGPIMFSVGPYNHGTPSTHAMQLKKYQLLAYILNLNHEKTLLDYLEAMRQLEKPARCCYANEFNLDRNNFAKMLLLNGCFMLMSLLGTEWYTPHQQNPENSTGRHNISEHKISLNPVLNERLDQDEGKLETIQCDIVSEDIHPIDQLYSLDFWHDVLLLENQIPFFIISELYELVEGGSSTATEILSEKVNEIVEGSLYCYPKAVQKHSRPKEFFHLLHLCHLYFRPRVVAAEGRENHTNPSLLHNLLQLGSNAFSKYEARSIREGQQATQQTIPSRRATEYQQAGIDIKKRKYSSEDPHSLLDIVFCNGILEIPGFTINPNTHLIKLPDDVALLTKRGIIVHQLNSDAEVCDLFRMIMECAVSFSEFNGGNYLRPLCSKIETHYQNRKPVLREFFLPQLHQKSMAGPKKVNPPNR